MTKDRWDELLDRDWSDAWDTLPEAPHLVPRAKSAQITLRLPAIMVARVRRVANARAIPHHTLVRSWIVEGLRSSAVPEVEGSDTEAQTAQLNIKLDQPVLDALKARGHELRKPYHRLAREMVEWETEQAEQVLGLDPAGVVQQGHGRRLASGERTDPHLGTRDAEDFAGPARGAPMASERTGKKAAANAGRTLGVKKASKAAKSAAGSALSQTKSSGVTGKKAGSSAGTTLGAKKSTKAAKSAAGSALTQKPAKKRARKG
ncbi:MAG: BrnA antitoxin family protein [Actinobacteria bacterium]|nr:BrnA antitoxin family protein [Actinomycetota bacterium]